jgi:hypothetical protein
MEYTVSAEAHNPSARFGSFGAEIQPPLSDLAAAGLCRALTHRKPDEAGWVSQFALDAYVVRSDQVGTVLYIQPNSELNDMSPVRPAYVARHIATLINPARKIITTIEPAE